MFPQGMVKPFISIIIATYNRSRILKRAIDSVCAQTYSHWELIIVDDRSTDDTVELLTGILTGITNHKITIFPLDGHQGLATARNKGIELVQGDFVTFLDSDDRYEKNHLESHAQIIQQYPQIDFFYGGVQVIGRKYVPDIERPGFQINVDNCVVGGTFFIRKSVLNGVGGFPYKQFGEDYALFHFIKEKGYSMMQVPLQTYIYDRTEDDCLTKAKVLMKADLSSVPE